MHLISELHRQPRKNRSRVERAFRYLYTALTAAQIGCFLVLVMQQSNASTKTFTSGIWFPASSELEFVMRTKLANCTYSASTTKAGYHIPDLNMAQIKEVLLARFA